jgi:carbonic anhydrase
MNQLPPITQQLPSVKMNKKLTEQLVEIHREEDVPEEWRDTPIGAFIMAQNFGWPIQTTGKPELLISTCIEFRYTFQVPRTYAYIIRRASGRVIGSEFSVGYTIARGVNHMVMIGHNDCGMSQIEQMAPLVVEAFVNQGWDRKLAEEYVEHHGARHAISDELGALKDEYERVHRIFPKLTVAPLFVCLYDSRLYLPKWYAPVKAKEKQETHNVQVPNEAIRSLPFISNEFGK